ncbi:MAG TPA: Ig-like domain repeat protein [Acidimicrobiia bacterium]
MPGRVKSWPVVGLCLMLLAWCGAPGTMSAARAAAPSASPAAASGPSGTPGAAPLGTTSYPIPTSGAYFVAPTGSDKAAGTQAAPWATLGHAVGVAPTHSTIVMRAGIYREADIINSKALTIQPYPNEAVIVRGSNVVTGFVQSGTTWVLKNWTYQFPRQNARAVDAQHPLANAPDQVFVDGAPLTQVAKAAAVNAKSFFVDYTAQQLVIGINPVGHTIEASTKTVGLHLEHAIGTVVRGIQFDEYATPASTHGAVLDSSGGATFENDWFLNNASAGLSIEGANTLVTHDTMANNGQLGLHANQADHLHVTETEVKQNNTEGFDEHEEAGGMKLSGSNDVLIDDNLADGNYGKGIWFDIASLRATIVRNQAYSNLDEGIQFEISSGAVIAGNVAWRNSGGGIRVIESQHVDIYNNVLYKNQSAVDVWEGTRPQNVADVTIRNNVMMDGTPGATSLLDIHDFTNKLTGAQMGVSTDADAFCRTTATQPPQVAAWANGAGKGQAHYTSITAFAKATGSDPHGIACDGAAAAKMLMNAPGGNFALASGSPGSNAGVALPSNVASALSVSPGIPVNLGLLGPGAVHGPGPTITSDPTDTSVLVGQTYSMSAAASGSPKPTVQWQVSPNGVTFTNIPGATSTRYTAVAAAGDNNKRFQAVFTNSGGVSVSDAATLTVSGTAVSIEDPGTLAWGQPLTLVADASMSGVPAANVTGSITFYDGSTKLGTRTVHGGVASMATKRLDAGAHSFVATYTVLRTTVTSDPTDVQITPADTAITLFRLDHKTIAVGGTLTITAKADVVSPSVGAVITGTISFYDDETLLGTVNVSTAGRAVLATPVSSAGTHSITVVYDGDNANYQPSAESAPLIVTAQ